MGVHFNWGEERKGNTRRKGRRERGRERDEGEKGQMNENWK